MSVAIAVTHQLTPYMVTAALVVLAVFGRTRTRWAPGVTLAPAVGWALLHLSNVKEYFSFDDLGNISNNIATPGAVRGGPIPDLLIRVNSLFLAADALIIGVVALAVLLRNRTGLNIALALGAASSGGLLLANAYGHEGDFRIVLFALPWLAILAADFRFAAQRRTIVLWSMVLPALLVAYLVADMSLDYINSVRPGDLQAVQTFEDRAPPGSTLIAIGDGYVPFTATGRYHLVDEEYYSAVRGFTTGSEHSPAISYGQFMQVMVGDRTAEHYFVLFAQQPAANMQALNLATSGQYMAFESEFARSRQWRLYLRTSTAELFGLVPAARR